MNWALLASDLAGRTLGLIGLVATAVAVSASSAHWQVGSDKFALMAGISLFMFSITAIFLIPSLYDRMLRTCLSVGPRAIFVIATGVWVVLALAAISRGFKPPHGLYSQYLPQWIALYMMAALGLLFVVFICPVGLTFSSARSFLLQTGGYVQPEKKETIPKENLRKRDIWDHLVELPLWLVLIFPSLAGFFGNAVPATGWNQWVTTNFWIALVGVGAITVLPGFFRTLIRPPHRKQIQVGTTAKVFGLLVGAPLIAVIGLWTLRYHGVPLAWNTLTENPVETIEYEVAHVSDSRRTRGCIYFIPRHAPDLEFLNCGLDSYSASRLKPGDIVRVTGELSWFGHSFEHVERQSE
ncbi:hypothetical protein [Ruegeria arenilitoris]|uniref:hypothetical protein n=1 Tax=Ruegeria arenilitoris TaxID=1173585 RepID=UPI00148105CC|nr:hypothetical protein [Ruegeria arenilitoris]